VNEYSELGIGIPLGERVLVEGLERRFVVRGLGLKAEKNQEAEQKKENDRADFANLGTKHERLLI
jgi:hypothetical protein